MNNDIRNSIIIGAVTFINILFVCVLIYLFSAYVNWPKVKVGECYAMIAEAEEKWERDTILDIFKIIDIGKTNYKVITYDRYWKKWNLNNFRSRRISGFHWNYDKIKCPPCEECYGK